jgi:hypothetical protein
MDTVEIKNTLKAAKEAIKKDPKEALKLCKVNQNTAYGKLKI